MNVAKVIEVVGVAVIVAGITYAAGAYAVGLVGSRGSERREGAFAELRKNLGRAILLGLEILVAADIIRTVAVQPSFTSVGVLGLIVVVRTFLSFSLQIEIDGSLPWRRVGAPAEERRANAL